MSKTADRGFIAWKPRRDALVLVQEIKSVLAEYDKHLPLTLRQVYYRLVATRGYPKTEAFYERLLRVAGKARRARLIRFEHIRDDGVFVETPYFEHDAGSALDDMKRRAELFRLNRMDGQATRIIVMCEAAGMLPQLAKVCDPYSVPVRSSGGFDSLTAKHQLAVHIARHGPTEILHVGDYDPSGVHLFTSLDEDVSAFTEEFGGWVKMTRLAVTERQIVEWALPTDHKKATDTRSFAGVNGDGVSTAQAESIDPRMLATLVNEAIVDRIDPEEFADVIARENDEKAALLRTVAPVEINQGRGRPGRVQPGSSLDKTIRRLYQGGQTIRRIEAFTGLSYGVVQRTIKRQDQTDEE